MFKIGDFSQLGQVSIRTLRLYDELGLLRPAQIDKFTGYRFYSIEQLPRLNRILALKDLGLSLEQIGDLLKRDLPADRLREMLKTKQTDIARQMREMQSQLRRVEARLKQIEQEGQSPKYEVVIKSVAAQTILSARGIVPTLDDMVGLRCRLYEDVYHWLADHAVRPLEPEMAIYHNSEYVEQDIDMEAAIPIESIGPIESAPPDRLLNDRVTVRELPAVETMATVIHRGEMWDVGQAITALYTWLGQHGYASNGPYRELHLFWRELEIETTQFENVTVEMQVPIVSL
jgi:DNA-binding transcriptional MerR regulator